MLISQCPHVHNKYGLDEGLPIKEQLPIQVFDWITNVSLICLIICVIDNQIKVK